MRGISALTRTVPLQAVPSARACPCRLCSHERWRREMLPQGFEHLTGTRQLTRNPECSSQRFELFHVLIAELLADLLKQADRIGRVQALSTTQTDFCSRRSLRSEIDTPAQQLLGLLRNDFSFAHGTLIKWNHLALLIRIRQLTHRAGSGLYVVISTAAPVSRL